jgi:hypothetical protein
MFLELINTLGVVNIIVFYTIPMGMSMTKLATFGVLKMLIGF